MLSKELNCEANCENARDYDDNFILSRKNQLNLIQIEERLDFLLRKKIHSFNRICDIWLQSD